VGYATTLMMHLPTGDNHRTRAPCLESAVSVGDETVNGMTAILGYARVSTTGQDSKNRPFFAR
jgi:hypothetical protein